MINDISGLKFDPKMAHVAAKHDVPVVLMHIKGTPKVMQLDVHYDCLLTEIMEYLEEGIEIAEEAGIDAGQIIIDPGIGFGKTAEDNLKIIRHLAELRSLGKPILLGPSRKSFIGKVLNSPVDQREEGTLASISAAIMNGANILRVHDVGPARKAAQVVPHEHPGYPGQHSMAGHRRYRYRFGAYLLDHHSHQGNEGRSDDLRPRLNHRRLHHFPKGRATNAALDPE